MTTLYDFTVDDIKGKAVDLAVPTPT